MKNVQDYKWSQIEKLEAELNKMEAPIFDFQNFENENETEYTKLQARINELKFGKTKTTPDTDK